MLRHIVLPMLVQAFALLVPEDQCAFPNAFYYFDDQPDAEEAKESSGNGLDVKITKDSHITRTGARFGTGCLMIERGKTAATAGWYAPLKKRSEFAEAISQMTITVWLHRTDVQAVTMIRRSALDETGGVFVFRIDRLNRLSFSVGQQTIQTEPLGSAAGAGWLHLAATFNRGRVTLYVDGEERASGDLGAPEISAAPLEGAFSFGLNAPEGTLVDDLGIFGKTLSLEQIKEVYQSGLEQFADHAK